MSPARPPKTRVTAWEAIEILMGRIDKELMHKYSPEEFENMILNKPSHDDKRESETHTDELVNIMCEYSRASEEFDSMASKITKPFSNPLF